MIFKLGAQIGASLTEDEQIEIEQWTNGKELEHLASLPGWQIIRNMLASYANDATASLLKLAPGDPAVPTAHAAWKTAQDIRDFFDMDVRRAIEAGREVPDVVRKRNSSGLPPEAL